MDDAHKVNCHLASFMISIWLTGIVSAVYHPFTLWPWWWSQQKEELLQSDKLKLITSFIALQQEATSAAVNCLGDNLASQETMVLSHPLLTLSLPQPRICNTKERIPLRICSTNNCVRQFPQQRGLSSSLLETRPTMKCMGKSNNNLLDAVNHRASHSRILVKWKCTYKETWRSQNKVMISSIVVFPYFFTSKLEVKRNPVSFKCLQHWAAFLN